MSCDRRSVIFKFELTVVFGDYFRMYFESWLQRWVIALRHRMLLRQ